MHFLKYLFLNLHSTCNFSPFWTLKYIHLYILLILFFIYSFFIIIYTYLYYIYYANGFFLNYHINQCYNSVGNLWMFYLAPSNCIACTVNTTGQSFTSQSSA